jgi:hypothetical protein
MSNEIKTESGKVVGQWDGAVATDLMSELKKIMKQLRDEGGRDKLNPKDMPHREQIPEDLQTFQPYRLWGCDKSQTCVVGARADRLEPVAKVRAFSFVEHH